MKKGRVKITNILIADALGFPRDWVIENISQLFDNYGNKLNGESEMLISGSDFPEANNRDDAEDVELIIHEKARTFEVKKCL